TATAPNGRLGLLKIEQIKPDVVLLDAEMPEMTGLEMLDLLRSANQRLPVIMFSSLTERGAAVTLDALMRGASDYATKPSSIGDGSSLAQVRDVLHAKIRALSARHDAVVAASPAPHAAPSGPGVRIDLVVIGVSTGGPNALAELLRGWPPS